MLWMTTHTRYTTEWLWALHCVAAVTKNSLEFSSMAQVIRDQLCKLTLNPSNIATWSVTSPDQCIDLGSINVIELLHWCFDLRLVCSHIHDEDQSIVVLNLLHGRLSGQGVLDDGIVVQLVGPGGRFPRIFGISCKLERLGKMKVHRGASFPLGGPPRPPQDSLLGLLCLGRLRGLGWTSLGLSCKSEHMFRMSTRNKIAGKSLLGR